MIAALLAAFALAAAPAGADAALAGLVDQFGQDGMPPDPVRYRAAYAEACSAGYALACTPERWAGLDLAAAAAVFGPACDAGDAAACLADGWAASQVDGKVDPKAGDLPRAVAHFTSACGLGLLRGCVELGTLYQLGVGVERMPERAVAQYQRACDGGEPTGCRRLGGMYQIGTVVGRDPAKALELYTRACDAGSAAGCNNIGLLWELGGPESGSPDAVRASAAYEAACDRGFAAACGNLARVMEADPAADKAEIRRLYGVGCDADVAGACLFLGSHLVLEPQDPPAAASAFTRACELGLPAACIELGVRQLRGDGVPEAVDAGAARLGHACTESGISDACATLAVAYDEGHFVRKDEVKGTDYFLAACDLDLGDACRIAGDRYRRGKGREKDPQTASALYFKACDLGDPLGCERAR